MKVSLADHRSMLLSQEDLWPSSTSRTLSHALCTIMNRTGRPSRIILPILVQLRLPHPLGVSKNYAPILRIAARTWQPARQQRHQSNTTMMITGLQVGDMPKCERDLQYISRGSPVPHERHSHITTHLLFAPAACSGRQPMQPKRSDIHYSLEPNRQSFGQYRCGMERT